MSISIHEDASRKELLLAKKKLEQEAPKPASVEPSKAFSLTLLLSVIVSQLMFLNISTFLPFHLAETCVGEGINKKCMSNTINSMPLSIILAMYNVARLLLSTTVGATMNKVGRKNYILIGFAFMILSTVGFGLLDYLPNDAVWIFFGCSIFFRFLQGIGGTCLQVAGQTIILSEFANNREKGLSYFNASRGLGIFLGPISGGVLYT